MQFLILTYTAEKHSKIQNPNRSPSALIMLLSFYNIPFSSCKEEKSSISLYANLSVAHFYFL